MSGQADCFLADAFHQAAITGEAIGMVVDKIIAKLVCQFALCHRHANRIGNALPQRASCCFDACSVAIFGVTSGLGAKLAEILDLVEVNILVSEQIQR